MFVVDKDQDLIVCVCRTAILKPFQLCFITFPGRIEL